MKFALSLNRSKIPLFFLHYCIFVISLTVVAFVVIVAVAAAVVVWEIKHLINVWKVRVMFGGPC